jgi:RNA polymerase sigma-70 factor (ECF subfamily)
MNDGFGVNELKYNNLKRFEDVYVEYYTTVFKYICGKINDYTTAEDLTCDVFYKALKNYGNYNSDLASVKTWLFKITVNHLKNYFRDKKVNYDIDEHIDDIKMITYKDDMAENAFLQECRNILAEGLDSVPEKNRKVIILKYFYNKTSAEIASELNISEGNVRVLTMRTLQKIAKHFKSKGIRLEDYII